MKTRGQRIGQPVRNAGTSNPLGRPSNRPPYGDSLPLTYLQVRRHSGSDWDVRWIVKMVSGRFISNNKTMSNKSIFIDEELHQKIKVLASMEGQSIKEWVEWVVERAYESAMRNKRPHLTKQP